MKLPEKLKGVAKDTVSDSVKGVWKWVRGILVGSLSLYALSIIQTYYGLDHAPTWKEVGPLLWNSVKALPRVVQEWFISRPYDLLVEEHPALSIAIIVLVGVAIVLAVLFFRATRIVNKQSAVLDSANENYTLVTQAGIKGRYPHARQADDGAPWNSLVEEILNSENKFVYILCGA